MKKIFTALALKFIGTTNTKLAQLDESKTVNVIKQGVDIVDVNLARVSTIIFWLKTIAISFIAIIVLLLINLGAMIFT